MALMVMFALHGFSLSLGNKWGNVLTDPSRSPRS